MWKLKVFTNSQPHETTQSACDRLLNFLNDNSILPQNCKINYIEKFDYYELFYFEK